MKTFLNTVPISEMIDEERHQIDELINDLENQAYDSCSVPISDYEPIPDPEPVWCRSCQEWCVECSNSDDMNEELQAEEALNNLESHYINAEEDIMIDEEIKGHVLLVIDVLSNAIFGLPDVEGYEDAIIYAHLDGDGQWLAEQYSRPVQEVVDYMIDEMISHGFTGLDGWKEFYAETLIKPGWREMILREFEYWNDHIKRAVYNQHHKEIDRR